ncbi:MAG: MarC family protein [Nanopusillaceae archaeon]|jgi:multiple antibiotic resistance protein
MIEQYIGILVTMFIILGTIPNIFVFESIFDSLELNINQKRYAINKSFLIAYIIWFIIFLFGKPFLEVIGINLIDFRIAGGIFLFYIAFEILAKDIPSHVNIKNHGEELENIIATPLAVPLITGPGVITTTLIYVSESLNIFYLFITMSLAFLISYLIIYNSTFILEKFGKKNLIILNKLGGLILLAIATDIILTGIKLLI